VERHFDQELQSLKDACSPMGGRASRRPESRRVASSGATSKLADEVIADDRWIDRIEIEIDEGLR